MPLIRSIGRWSLTALVINCIIGSGIFGVPGELIKALGRASPLAMVLAGLGTAVVLACFAEIGSQFTEPGGVYLFARTAFGRFVGLQVGWFWFLSTLGAAAANANLFLNYLAGSAPWAEHLVPRLLIITGLLLVPTAANYVGVRGGTMLSNLFTIAKLLPLALLIVLGLVRFGRHAEVVRAAEITAPGWLAWGNALLLLSFVYSGFEDTTMPTGEVKDPQRTVPVSLAGGLAVCIAVYTLLQFVTTATVGPAATDRPLAESATVLIGRGGALFVEIAAMISTYGWLSASMVNAPRFLFSLAQKGEFPVAFGRLHARFNTPHLSVIFFAGLAWLLAVTGTFRWSLLVSAGATVVCDGVVCAALLRLRRIQPQAASFRLPFGRVFSYLGVGICLFLLSRLEMTEALLMGVTGLLAAANWWWARRRARLQAPPTCPMMDVAA
jgi:amino acid transporter